MRVTQPFRMMSTVQQEWQIFAPSEIVLESYAYKGDGDVELKDVCLGTRHKTIYIKREREGGKKWDEP